MSSQINPDLDKNMSIATSEYIKSTAFERRFFWYDGFNRGQELVKSEFALGGGFMPGTTGETFKCRPQSIMISDLKGLL